MSGKRQLESWGGLDLLVQMTHLMIICLGLCHWSMLPLTKSMTTEPPQTTLFMAEVTGSYLMSSSNKSRYL